MRIVLVRPFLIHTTAFGIGIVVSIKLGDWMWFARSGALATALVLFNILGKLQSSFTRQVQPFLPPNETLLALEKFAKEHGAEIVRDTPEGKIQIGRDTPESNLHNLSETEKTGGELLSTAQQIIENRPLLIGTLVWGFGDLLGKLKFW